MLKKVLETAICAAAVLALGARASAKGPLPLDRPMVPLMTLTGAMPVPEDPAEIATIAETYRLVNAHRGMATPEKGKTVAARFRQINPAFRLSHYRNGTYVQQGCREEAAEVEHGLPLAIAVWRPPARLMEPVAAEATSIVVAVSPRPEGVAPSYPFKASTTRAEYSRTKNEYVAWLRLADEIVRIEAAAPDGEGRIRLDVQRGLWGSSAVEHAATTPVLLPVYIGSVRAGLDVPLSGVPDSSSPQMGLRYALQAHHPGFHEWLGDKCAELFDAGFDVVWLDITSSTWYNNGDAYERAVTPWNLLCKRPLDQAAQIEYQQRKVDAMFARFPDREFFVNNVKADAYFGPAGERRLLSGDDDHHPVTGGSMEYYANVRDEASWQRLVAMTRDFVRSGFRGVAWSKNDRMKDLQRYRLFAYATFLMAWEPDSPLMFGGGWAPRRRPEAFFYWDLGRPQAQHDDVAQAARGDGSGVYQRRFSQGLVLVNPQRRPSPSIALEQRWLDPQVDAVIDRVELAPLSAKLLLLPP